MIENSSLCPRLIDIPRHIDVRGNLSVIDGKTCLPFELKRIFYIYDIPSGVERGGHAHRTLYQFICALSGSIKVSTIDYYGRTAEWVLQLPWEGLLIPPLTWANETAISGGCVYLVGASDYYDESDYIRNKDEFTYLSTKEYL